MSEYSIANPRKCYCGGIPVITPSQINGKFYTACSYCGGRTEQEYDGMVEAMESWNNEEVIGCLKSPVEQFHDSHYLGYVQPIELMQEQFTAEEFRGYLKGNIIKYASRLGKKDDPKKEADKILNYANWLHEHTYKGKITVGK